MMTRCDLRRVPIFSYRHKLWVAEMMVGRPFEEFDHGNELRLEPAAFLHVLGRQAFAPSALTRFGKIPKRGFGDRQILFFRIRRPPRSWIEAVPNAAGVH